MDERKFFEAAISIHCLVRYEAGWPWVSIATRGRLPYATAYPFRTRLGVVFFVFASRSKLSPPRAWPPSPFAGIFRHEAGWTWVQFASRGGNFYSPALPGTKRARRVLVLPRDRRPTYIFANQVNRHSFTEKILPRDSSGCVYAWVPVPARILSVS